ncbi:DUF5615 family PIN-like protein [Patescibacteria group bacterium]|nr:DUF5615 family PIN-like protein [Patescibacteria group bacterium]
MSITRKDRNKAKKTRKFRFLLDSAFAKPSEFPKLSKKSSLAHSVFNYGLSKQAPDEEIHNLAVKENYLVVTFNFKHFKKLVQANPKSGAICPPPYSSNREIDELLSKYISGKNPGDFLGKTMKIHPEN